MLTLPITKRTGQPTVIAFCLGAGLVTCFAPIGLFWLMPPLLAGLFVLLRATPSPQQATRLGFAFGLGFFLTGVSWVFVSLHEFGGMPWWIAGPATFLFCAFLALYPAIASHLFRRLLPSQRWQQMVGFAAVFAAVDWLRGWLFTGFPWLAFGYAQAAPSPLGAFAPIIGVFGISFAVLLVAASLVHWRTWPVAIVLLGLGFLLTPLPWTTPAGAPITVALVQGNVPQTMKFRPEAFAETLMRYRHLMASHPAQLTLLPETALPAFFDRIPDDYLNDLRDLATSQGGDVLIGTVTGDSTQYFNSAVSIGHSPRQTYRKIHLVPFGESIPRGFGWFMAMADIPMSAFSAGPDNQAALAIGGTHVAVNICYEDIFGEELIARLPSTGVLANLSNTAWFGQSLAQPQHLQMAQMRSRETGRPMLRSTNTGMTAIINPRGDIEAALPPFTTAVLTGTIQPYTGQTPYARAGNLPFLMLCGLAGLAALRGRRRSQ